MNSYRNFIVRFVVFGFLMALANVIPYLFTRGAAATDGHEMAGFPFRCYQIAGANGMFMFNPWAMMGNMMVVILVAALAGWLFRDGVLITLRRWQTWGTPHAA